MKHVAQLASHDPIWDTIRHAAASLAAEEPILGSLAHASVLNQSCFEYALSYILAQRLGAPAGATRSSRSPPIRRPMSGTITRWLLQSR
jgi:hypothetical protein